MNKYKVFFHSGDDLTLKTRVTQGDAWTDKDGLHVASNGQSLLVTGRDVRSVELFRLHGLGRVIRIDHINGRIFISVVRLMIGQFAFINFFKTGALKDEIARFLQTSF